MTTAFVSLFRGINVGGNHQVKMDELRALHESLGLRDVLSYIQSGNVVFHCDDANVAQLRSQIERSFETTFGFHSEVLIRTSDELQEIITYNPFQGQPGKELKLVLVMFLAVRPDDAAQEDLLKSYGGPEELRIIGKEVHIYYPNGMGRSKLSGTFIEKKLKTAGTARNWNTVLQLQQLMQRHVQPSDSGIWKTPG
ncbi:MAG TPA: DUF1697 domain-containing protein [Ktedonobacterales bacterium]|jgi:uncharacterized protein (DUF1697 family)